MRAVVVLALVATMAARPKILSLLDASSTQFTRPANTGGVSPVILSVSVLKLRSL